MTLREERAGDHWVRIHPEDRLFLEEESLRLSQDRFRRTRRLARFCMADTLASLLREVRRFREGCSCGAADAEPARSPTLPTAEDAEAGSLPSHPQPAAAPTGARGRG